VQTVGPEDIFHYMYAVFYSPTYRARYAEFLKIDFPRLPLTSNLTLLRDLCVLGEELIQLHLMEQIPEPKVTYPIPGDNLVEQPRYSKPQSDQPGRIWLNPHQYFENIEPEVWSFRIGGYPVCEKWLKDRKNHKLLYEDIQHYRRMIAVLQETIRLMNRIDQSIPAFPIV
jgi:predicted helicase